VGERVHALALGEVLTKQAVGVLVGAALPRTVRLGEVGHGIQSDVDHAMLGKLAAVVVRERAHAATRAVQGRHDRISRGSRLAVGHATQAHEARFALHHRDEAHRPVAQHAVEFPMTDLPALLDRAGPRVDAPPAKALTLARCADTASPASSSAMPPQVATAGAILGDVLVDAFDADRSDPMADDLLGTPVLAQVLVNDNPYRCVYARTRTGRMAP